MRRRCMTVGLALASGLCLAVTTAPAVAADTAQGAAAETQERGDDDRGGDRGPGHGGGHGKPGGGHGKPGRGPVVVDERQATATGWGGAVASLDPYASEAGLEILRKGGNAVDAAVATAATLGVTRPYDGSIGGGGFWVIYDSRTRQVSTIDARETAPAATTPDVWLENGEPIPFEQRRVSGLAVGVPGVVAGWELALAEHGSRSLRQVLEPAIEVAERGFVVDAEYERRTEDNLEIFQSFTSTAETFLVDGEAPQAGDVFRNRDLADTYRLIARHGADAFYSGDLAETIVEVVQEPPLADDVTRVVRPGTMELADITGYVAVPREPTLVEYNGQRVWGMAPPSSGGSTVGEALNILENFDLGSMSEAQVDHHIIEAAALAFADRNAFIGDPDQVPGMPLETLLSQEYADERAALVGPTASEKPVAPGDGEVGEDGGLEAGAGISTETDGSTTHLTVADRWGNVVSHTFTIEQIGGSGIAVPGYGFILNNELTDFETAVGLPNSPDAGKRPRSSMAPTIVTDARNRPVAAFGSPGGATIINTVLQIAVDHLERGYSLPEAIAAPRLSNTNSSTTQAEPGIPTAELTALGHELVPATGGVIGNATGVAFLRHGLVQAAAEPERSGGGSAVVLHEPRRR